jgi:hypothetical protein
MTDNQTPKSDNELISDDDIFAALRAAAIEGMIREITGNSKDEEE